MFHLIITAKVEVSSYTPSHKLSINSCRIAIERAMHTFAKPG